MESVVNMSKIIQQDLVHIYDALTEEEKKCFQDATLLLTGGAGFLGFYFLSFMAKYKEELNIKEIICLDNFLVGMPKWVQDYKKENLVSFYNFDIIKDDISAIPGAEKADYIYHMASVASPIFYRKYPIETLDANIWGLRKLLDFYCEKDIKGLVFYSSSEIYGDPSPDNIPTSEEYLGYVDCLGPRACYDEAKRFGETMCYLFHQQHKMPITVIRPFNNYGPGMRLNDARVPADFATAVSKNEDIVILSDGKPTRTFCYVTDAVIGDLKGMVHISKEKFDVYNIGMDKPEISIADLAKIFQKVGKEIFDYTGTIKFGTSEDKDYLINNPNRRCPNIDKARKELGYCPKIELEQGIRYFLQYIKESQEDELTW